MTAASGASPWTSGDVHADAIVAVAVLAFAYLRAWRARGVTIPWTIAWRGIAALGVTLSAVSGPLHALSEGYLFSAHMVQHLLLTLVVPPLALTGMPAFMIDALLAPWCRRPFTACRPAGRDGREAKRLARSFPMRLRTTGTRDRDAGV